MADLAIGDHVKVADNKYELVYSFGHKKDEVLAEYLQITTEGGRSPLKISSNHMVMVDSDRAIPASILKKGDMVVTASGEVASVKSIETVLGKGAFAPFTESGKIVVNDLVASNYISYQDSEYLKIGCFETPIRYQWLAHAFNAAHRLAFKIGFQGESYTGSGLSRWVDVPHQIGEWLIEQEPVVVLAILLPSMGVFGFLCVVETAIANPVALWTVMTGIFALVLAGKRHSFKMTAKKL
jgi:hypothetical protein